MGDNELDALRQKRLNEMESQFVSGSSQYSSLYSISMEISHSHFTHNRTWNKFFFVISRILKVVKMLINKKHYKIGLDNKKK